MASSIYEPVEEYRRATFNALMERKYGIGARNRSQSTSLSSTPRENFTDGGDATRESTGGASVVPPDTDPEAYTVMEKLAELIHQVTTTKNVEASNEPCTLSSTQTQQAGPSRIDASPFSQYSIHPDSLEPSDRNSAPVTAGSKEKQPPSPSLQPSLKIRPFKASARSQGNTIWMTTASYEELFNPPEPAPEDESGILYIHENLLNDALQVWLLGNEKQWASVQLSARTRHPTFGDRYLAIRLDRTPTWLTLSSWYGAKKWVNDR